MLTDTVKFSALGVNRAHLQDVVQVDFARALETQYKDLERDASAALGALNAGHHERAAEILRIALHREGDAR